MKRKLIEKCTAAFVLSVALFLLVGCGGGGGGGSVAAPVTVSGVVATGVPLFPAKVTLTDSAASPVVKPAVDTDSNGNYSIDVTGLTKPYLLKAVKSGTTLYSVATDKGTANINPLTNLIVANAAGTSDPTTAKNLDLATATSAVKSKLTDLLALYSPGLGDPISSPYPAIGTGLDSLFDVVKITASGGSVAITTTGGLPIMNSTFANIPTATITSANIPYSVTGKLVTSDGAAFPMVTVQLASASSGAVIASKVTDTNGAYAFIGVPKGTYSLGSGDAKFQFVAMPVTVGSSDVTVSDIIARSLFTVTGKISWDGSGTNGATSVSVYKANFSLYDLTLSTTSTAYLTSASIYDPAHKYGTDAPTYDLTKPLFTKQTDSNGDFSIAGLPKGSYILVPSRSGYKYKTVISGEIEDTTIFSLRENDTNLYIYDVDGIGRGNHLVTASPLTASIIYNAPLLQFSGNGVSGFDFTMAKESTGTVQ